LLLLLLLLLLLRIEDLELIMLINSKHVVGYAGAVGEARGC
jgi:hypothetical protein